MQYTIFYIQQLERYIQSIILKRWQISFANIIVGNIFSSGNMGVLINRDIIIGTGCYDGNHITGVYVSPDYQKQGCGSRIMDCLELEISKKHDTALLDASLSAVCLYEHRGYKTVGHGIIELKNDVKLVYEIMEKKLKVN